jgi:hypothetical protein
VLDQAYGGTGTTIGYNGFKNRIINGDCRIDQRNAGASVTPTANTVTYTLDRWFQYQTAASKFSVQRNAGSVTPPSGFTNYLGITSLSAYSASSSDVFLSSQYIEGFNVADFAWGTAGATSATVSFWVRSSLTGTFSFSVCNFNSSRNYIATYTISSANTWEYKTVTIPGDTAGSWVTDNGIGLQLRFDLGSGSSYNGTAGAWSASNLLRTSGSQSVIGTSGATFYITGCQLEKGSTATSYDYRPYTTEVQLCQRYYWRIQGETSVNGYAAIGTGTAIDSVNTFLVQKTPVRMRASPTLSFNGTIQLYPAGGTATSFPNTYSSLSNDVIFAQVACTGGLTNGLCVTFYTANNSNNWFAVSAEL